MRRQRGLDLAKLDADAANLDLVIDASQVVEGAVGPPTRKVAGAVHALAGRRGMGVGHEPLRSQAGTVQIAARRPTPAMYSSPAAPTAAGPEILIENIDPRIPDRSADGGADIAVVPLARPRSDID